MLPPGPPTRDHEAVRVGPALLDEEPRRVDAVIDVDLTPASVQPLAIRAAVPGAAAVVHVDDREAPAGEVLDLEVELGDGLPRRTTVALHDERRPFTVGGDRVAVGRRVVVRVRDPALGREG